MVMLDKWSSGSILVHIGGGDSGHRREVGLSLTRSLILVYVTKKTGTGRESGRIEPTGLTVYRVASIF